MIPRLLVFDSGVGGLSVLREIRDAVPAAEITYVADDAAFPYGAWEAAALTARIVALMDGLVAVHRPDLVTIACNTASTLVLPPLRQRHAIAFVGTVPAIKPAAERTRSGLVSVLATPGTIARDYTRDLIRAFAGNVDVRLVGSSRLAGLAENLMRGDLVDDAVIAAEIAPCFVAAEGRRTDTVVLACTHYPFLLDAFRRVAPWPVEWIDPAPAIARRVATLLPAPAAEARLGEMPRGTASLTSGAAWPAKLLPVLARLGLLAAVPGASQSEYAVAAAGSS